MVGYFYLDQLACLNFRIFHMLLEICKCIGIFQFLNFLLNGVPDDIPNIFRKALVWLPVVSTFSFD